MLPQFSKEDAARSQPEVWEKCWKQFKEQCWAAGLSDDHGAIMLKPMCPDGGPVAEATRDLILEDGALQKTYFEIHLLAGS